MNVLITGGTGFIGKELSAFLIQNGHQVKILSRKGGDYTWNIPQKTIDPGAFDGIDCIVHLAGAGIADKPWTKARKAELIASRVESTQLLVEQLKSIPHQVKTFVSASAIGFYGADTGEQICTETSPAGTDFLADCTQQWEKSVDEIAELGIRTVKVRIGLVLSQKGGIFPVLARPIRWGLGTVLGTGKQWQSWIHLSDLVRIFQWCIENNAAQGAYNAVAPQPIRHKEMTEIMAKKMHRHLFLPSVPAWILKLLLGEMAVLVTGGNRVSSKKIQEEANFSFNFVEFPTTLAEILSHNV
jgi:uncharacterized protein (TIGR01777 family)